jgi:hypothetical protein
VLQGEKVANSEKIFSIFEPHTELLIRGKASKPIEFGHMVLLQQVQEAGKINRNYLCDPPLSDRARVWMLMELVKLAPRFAARASVLSSADSPMLA